MTETLDLELDTQNTEIEKQNFRKVQVDAIGVGLASSAGPFLPVFLTRLNASTFQVSLLTTMPAIAGLLLALPLGSLLQRQKKIVPWFSASRLAVLSGYFLTGLVAFLVPQKALIIAVLLVWALVTIPQTMLAICFSVVMNAVAGPNKRYALMSKRWSTLGVTTAITVFLMGILLDKFKFPLGYQWMFIVLSFGGLISFYFSSTIKLPDLEVPEKTHKTTIKAQIGEYAHLVRSEKPFVSFVLKRFVFLTGTTLSLPLLPIYFVREVHMTDSWIATIATVQTTIMVVGYFFWARQSRRKSSRTVLLWTTFGLSFYPLLTAMTHQAWVIAVFAGITGIFQAGADLVFFDELMKTFPAEYSATFVSLAQGFQYLSAIIAPLIGSALADSIGLGSALVISSVIRLVGFGLFALDRPKRKATLLNTLVEG